MKPTRLVTLGLAPSRFTAWAISSGAGRFDKTPAEMAQLTLESNRRGGYRARRVKQWNAAARRKRRAAP